jgi:hypothetical protein
VLLVALVVVGLARALRSDDLAYLPSSGIGPDGTSLLLPGSTRPRALAPGASQVSARVAFVLFAGSEIAFERAEVEIDLPSGPVVVPLVDDGSLPEDLAWDGVYVGIWSGPFQRWAQVRLLAGAQDAPAVLAEGLERFYGVRGVQIAWRLIPADGRVVAVRTAASALGGSDDTQGRLELLASFGWAALLAVFLGTLALRAREPRP